MATLPLTRQDLDAIVAQADETSPYYLAALVTQARLALDLRCVDCGTTDFTGGRGEYPDGHVCALCTQVRMCKEAY